MTSSVSAKVKGDLSLLPAPQGRWGTLRAFSLPGKCGGFAAKDKRENAGGLGRGPLTGIVTGRGRGEELCKTVAEPRVQQGTESNRAFHSLCGGDLRKKLQ